MHTRKSQKTGDRTPRTNRPDDPSAYRLTPTLDSTSFDKSLVSIDDQELQSIWEAPSRFPNGKLGFLRFGPTYATFALTLSRVDIHLLAKQTGTSITMIERHYSYVIARMRAKDSAGPAHGVYVELDE
jgi:hypothetical protein